jgi:hypothetical protein
LALRLESCSRSSVGGCFVREMYIRCRHMGHFSWELSCLSHEKMQCWVHVNAPLEAVVTNEHTMWKEWLHSPSTICDQPMPLRTVYKRRRTQRTLVARELALGACAIVGISADTADVVVGHVPAPCRDGIPFSNGDLHRDSSKVFTWKLDRFARRLLERKQTRLMLASDMHGTLSKSGSTQAPHGGDDSLPSCAV